MMIALLVWLGIGLLTGLMAACTFGRPKGAAEWGAACFAVALISTTGPLVPLLMLYGWVRSR